MKRISYYYDPNIGNYNYSQGHPMKPFRVRMTHSLICNYGLYKKLNVHKPTNASFENLTNFHSTDYINFLQSVTKDNMQEMLTELSKFNVGDDCPVFSGLYDYCLSTTGGTLNCAYKLNTKISDIAINYSGGLHHAKRSEASGFCYVNDIVLGVLELLKYNERVLYVDIDVHHGDGVEEAFYTTDRVMTVSFHKYGDFFPGTGNLFDTGELNGKNFAINVPLKDGMDDDSYARIFKPVISRVMDVFNPNAVVLQCGADSLAGDRLGCFNLTNYGHAECVKFMKSFNVPLMILGGGGYTVKNVSRCWTYETSVLLDVEIPDELPFTEFYEHFTPDYKLNIPAQTMVNMNTHRDMESIIETVHENLRNIKTAPSCQMVDIPPSFVEDASNDVVYERLKHEQSSEFETEDESDE